MTPKELASHTKKLRNQAPITMGFSRSPRYTGLKDLANHQDFDGKGKWLGWLETYMGPHPRRKDWNRTAEFVYNHLNSPSMALWLGEACGLSEALILRARTAALRAGPNVGTQSAAIRKVVSWKKIEFQLEARSEGRPHRQS